MSVTSGSYGTNQISKSYFYVGWEQVSQSTSTNSTIINWWAGIYNGTSSSHDNFYSNAVKIYNVYINGVLVSNGGTWGNITTGGYHTLISGTLEIPHENDGTKTFSSSISAWTYSSSNYYGEGSFELTSIPRYATITSVADFTDEQNPTIVYSNKAGNSVTTLQACMSLDGYTEDIPYRDIPKLGTSYTFELTEAERTLLRNATTGKRKIIVFIVKTVLGGDQYQSSDTAFMNIVNANPTIDTITYRDTNGTTTGVTHNDQVIVQGLSLLQFQMYDINALKGATLSSLSININGEVQTTSYGGTSVASTTYDFEEVDVSDNTNAVLTLTDSRGFSSTYNVPLTIWEYSDPTAIINVSRQNNFYTQSDINVDANYSSLDGLNTIDIKFRIKKSDGVSWGAWTTINDNVDASFNADNQYAWDLQVQLEDIFGTTKLYTLNKALDVGIPIVFYDVIRRSVGINCFPTNNESFEVSGKTIYEMIYPVGSTYTSSDNTNPSTKFGGTWTQIECNEIVESGMLSANGISYCIYRIFANGNFEVEGVASGYDLASNTGHTLTITFPYTINAMVGVSGLAYGGNYFANIQSYCYSNGTTINIYTWNTASSTATYIQDSFICKGVIDIANSGIATLYSWKRTA